MAIFIEIYSQIHIFIEFKSKKRAKTINRDTNEKKKVVTIQPFLMFFTGRIVETRSRSLASEHPCR